MLKMYVVLNFLIYLKNPVFVGVCEYVHLKSFQTQKNCYGTLHHIKHTILERQHWAEFKHLNDFNMWL